MQIDVCTYENRLEDFLSLKILIKTAARNFPVALFHIPSDGHHPSVIEWLSIQDNVRLRDDIKVSNEGGWDVKPFILRDLLESGLERVLWIDSDISFSARPQVLLNLNARNDLLVCEEGYRGENVGTAVRTRGLGLPVGQEISKGLNTCVLGVSQEHLPLINAWADLTNRTDYQAEKKLLSPRRRFYLHGDQELLSGLVGSAGYENLNVSFLRSGRDIVHCISAVEYGLFRRFRTLFAGEPPMAHAQQFKFWREDYVEKKKGRVRTTMYYLSAVAALDADSEERQALTKRYGYPFAFQLLKSRPSFLGLGDGLKGTTRYILSRAKRNIMRLR
jgi:hypothetical protein